MVRKKFLKLYKTLEERVEKEGKIGAKYFLGYLEGFGNQKMTGYQVGALYHLLVLPNCTVSEHEKEVNESVPEESKAFFIPGIS